MKTRHGFTLLEILAVVSILGILAAITVPQFASVAKEARPTAMAATVVNVRKQIAYHAGIGDVVMSEDGFPDEIDPSWFIGGMPKHAWAGGPMTVKVKDEDADEVYPGDKTYEPNKKNAWYNTTNGAFCVLIPDTIEDEAEIIAVFNQANLASITEIDQKER